MAAATLIAGLYYFMRGFTNFDAMGFGFLFGEMLSVFAIIIWLVDLVTKSAIKSKRAFLLTQSLIAIALLIFVFEWF